MQSTTHKASQYPAALVNWAGHHSGGVRRMFDDDSGRPNREVLPTNLLARLESWTRQLVAGVAGTPRILLLVGGPGNGKTEAIESTIRWLDNALGCEQRLVHHLGLAFHPEAGKAVPRTVRIDAGKLASPMVQRELCIVQDASVNAGDEGKSPAELLIDELCNALDGPASSAYLCCVNRGILDDALIHAQENGMAAPTRLLEKITRAVSLAPDAPSCWPLEAYESIGVWPMDAESLLVKTDAGMGSPAAVLLGQALAEEHWPAQGTCAAGDKCPFCTSRALLSRDVTRDSLLRILRWYELLMGTGKKKSYAEYIATRLQDNGYQVSPGLLNCADFGVPQNRQRFLMICERKDQQGSSLNLFNALRKSRSGFLEGRGLPTDKHVSASTLPSDKSLNDGAITFLEATSCVRNFLATFTLCCAGRSTPIEFSWAAISRNDGAIGDKSFPLGAAIPSPESIFNRREQSLSSWPSLCPFFWPSWRYPALKLIA